MFLYNVAHAITDFCGEAEPFNVFFLLEIPRDISFTLSFIDVLNDSEYVIHILDLGLQETVQNSDLDGSLLSSVRGTF